MEWLMKTTTLNELDLRDNSPHSVGMDIVHSISRNFESVSLHFQLIDLRIRPGSFPVDIPFCGTLS
jgi:hypothetical protein